MSKERPRLNPQVINDVNMILKFYDLYFLRLLEAGIIFDDNVEKLRAYEYLRSFFPSFGKNMRDLQEDVAWLMRSLDNINPNWERDFLQFSQRKRSEQSK